MTDNLRRRDFIKKSLLLSGGLAVGGSLEERTLLAADADEKTTSARPASRASGQTLPAGKIRDLNISRLICGGNLTSGFAHARDLLYASSLLNHYFTDEKILETWELCEECGINTAILRLDSKVIGLINKYWNERGGKIQWIAQVKPKPDDLTTDFQRALDNGASAIYVQGQVGDSFVDQGRVDLLAKCVDFYKENDAAGGIGGHKLSTIQACEKAGLAPDFYMKTIHGHDYWSADLKDQHDNIWSEKPEETIAYMQKIEKPWIGFKVMAAGAIHPNKAFRQAFESGADFICAGMFDFQVREDAIIARNALSNDLKRERPWRG